MIIAKDYKLNVWLSGKSYKSKPDAADYKSMRWDDVTLSLEDFIDRIRDGYSYCHIYSGNRRLKSEFRYSQVVSIDVDDTCINMNRFIESCSIKPTFSYETFSNGIDGFYSYRLVFVFAEKLSGECYPLVYDRLCTLCGLEDTKDHCGKVLTQLMNGTTHDAGLYVSNNIYSIMSDSQFGIELQDNITCNDKILGVNHNIQSYNNSHNQKQYKRKVANCKNGLEDSFDAIDMLAEDMEQFLNFYGKIFKVIREQKLYFNQSGYCVIPEDHLSLFVRYSRTKNGSVINRFKDGEKRRNRLFIDGCIIRKIKPDITFLELLYNLAHRVFYYYDNSDGILSTDLIV